MITLIADTHTHTLATDHAYSTIQENAVAAAKKGLRAIAFTEHCPAFPGAPTDILFETLVFLPRYVEGVMILKGAELNILDYDGAIDLKEHRLNDLEWVIASYHPYVIAPASEKEHTRGWMNIINNPYVGVIGHPGDSRFAFDHKTVIREVANAGKLVEINAHDALAIRPGSDVIIQKIALLCAEYGVPVVIGSDAHYHGMIGNFEKALAVLAEIDFPEELILNADYDRFIAHARKMSGKTLTDE